MTIGRPMAITEPKASSSTTTATASPMASLPSTSLPAAARSPESSVCTPASRVGVIASTASSYCSFDRVCSENWTVA